MTAQPISFPGTHGAGIYGRVEGRKSDCVNAQNPFGHNPECLCGWARPPYLDDIEETTDET